MKIKIVPFSLFLIFMLINSYSILNSNEARISNNWIPELEDSIKLVSFPRPFWDTAFSWRILTSNDFRMDKKIGKITTIHIIKKDRVSKGYLEFYRLKECSSIDASYFVRYQDYGNVADRFNIYWGEFKNDQSLPVRYNFTILKDGHFRLSKLSDKSKPNWVCIHDGYVNNWKPANNYNVISIQQQGFECKISVNGGIQMYTRLDSFEGVETGFSIYYNDSWDINKIRLAE